MIKIIVLSLLLIIQIQAKTAKEFIVYGKLDNRLYVTLLTTYRSMNPNDLRQDYEKCTQANWNTGTRQRSLNYDFVKLVANKDGQYKASIPIEFMDKNNCGWEYVNTALRIRRDKADDLYANIQIANINQKANNVYQGTKTGMRESGLWGKYGTKTTKKHYQISSGSMIECYTTYGGYSKRLKRILPNSFTCLPIAHNKINGVDEFKTASINLDIIINEDKCTENSTGYKDFFRDYKEETSFLDKIKSKIKNIFN